MSLAKMQWQVVALVLVPWASLIFFTALFNMLNYNLFYFSESKAKDVFTCAKCFHQKHRQFVALALAP